MKINIGTDCSGIEAPIQALEKLCKKYKQLSYHHSFSSEIDKYAISCIRENYQPDILFYTFLYLFRFLIYQYI